MKKQLILLAISRKYGRFCVAGVDVKSGAMVRLISADSDAHYAVEAELMTFADGSTARKLDLVEVDCLDRSISYFQNENYVLNKRARWTKLRSAGLDEALAVHPANKHDKVFYDRTRKLHRDCFMTLDPREVRSLMLIRPDSCELLIQQSWERRQALFAFVYRGETYEPFPITDPEYLATVEQHPEGRHPLPEPPHLLVSVGECFEQDKCHYKIAAGVFL